MSNTLIGKTLTGMKIADDKQAILFNTSDGDVVAKCDADCCSVTWVEHIELPALGFPALVVAVGALDLPVLTMTTLTTTVWQCMGAKLPPIRAR